MGEKEEIETLAESLKNSGLAASMTDARIKAEEILGYSNKGVKIRVEEPPTEQKEKVEEIIKEVDQEIETKKETKVEKPEPLKKEKDLSQFDDVSFNVAESNMKVSDLVKDEVMTNDEEILEQEKEADQIEEMSETQEESETAENIVKTNDEINQEESNDEETEETNEEQEDTQPEEKEEAKLTEEEEKMTDLTSLFNVNK